MRFVALVALLLGLWTASASAATGFVTMDDGVKLQYILAAPPGTAPVGGWPGLVVMHGLGGSADDMAPVVQAFADAGYAALAFSVRGQGTSGGTLGLAGPRDVADMKAMVAWLEARPEVNAHIGCFGVSLGGGECWNATPAGLFDAIAPVATWTDIATALWPGGVTRSGILSSLAGSSTLGAAALSTTLSPLVAPLLAQRSVAGELPSITTPVYLFQGRDDWVFDVGQALKAFQRVGGPHKLYVGDFGHAPSTFSSPDFPTYVVAESIRWFDRWLKGTQNGVEQPAVTIASANGRTRRVFTGLPATRVVRTGPSARSVTTFGPSTVTVRVRSVRAYPRLVAVIRANGKVVTHGAVVPRVGVNRIPLGDYVVDIPKGARITVTLNAAGDEAYAGVPASGGTISLGKPTLALSVLAR